MTETQASLSPSRAGYWVIALVSCAVLTFEIALTRVLSVVIWYHFAFLVVSLAMLGLGAPGVWFSLRPPPGDLLWKLLVAAGLAIPGSIACVVKLGEWLPPGAGVDGLRVALIALASLVPLLLTGAALCLLLIGARGRRIGGMYAADLLGATLGACAVVPLMHVMATPKLLAGLGFLPLLGATILRRRSLWWPGTVAGAVALSLVWGEPFQIRQGKTYDEQAAGVIYEKWSPTARLTVFPSLFWLARGGGEERHAFGWGMGTRFRERPLEQMWIEQDGSAGMPVTRFDGAATDLGHLFYDVTSVGYQLRPPRRVCVVGAGGGRDILTALEAGAEHVDAVEINGEIIRIVSERFRDYSGDVYHLPGVTAHAREGRSFLSRSEGRYGLIQISLTDSWAATAAGAYALSENYLYTLEALRLYLQRVGDRGLVSISRWMRGESQFEAVRMSLLAEAALRAEGIDDPGRHLVVVQGDWVATFLISPSPFDARELARLDRIVEKRGFTRHWPPSANSPSGSLVASVLMRGAADLEAQGLTLEPPTDDRPFFFQNVRVFSRLEPSLRGAISVNDRAARLVGVPLVVMAALTLALFFAPFALARRLERSSHFWRGSGYFVAIGAGFMLLEIPLIQRFILYLGHPSYAVTVVLSTLLLGSGIGAWRAGRTGLGRAWRWRFAVPLAAVGVAAGLSPFFAATLAWPLPARVALCFASIGPLGFLLGFAFPVGMIRFGDASRAWFWALNGAAGVLASAATVAIAPYVGLTGMIVAGVACYIVACLALPRPDSVREVPT